jgi:hypothetical protein
MTSYVYDTIIQLNRVTLPSLTAVAFNSDAIGNRAQKNVTPSSRSGTLLATLSTGRPRSAIHRAASGMRHAAPIQHSPSRDNPTIPGASPYTI